MIACHGYLCFVMIPDDAQKKRQRVEGGRRATDRPCEPPPLSGRFRDTRVELPVVAAETSQPKGVRM